MHAISSIQTPIKSFTLKKRHNNMYVIYIDETVINSVSCLIVNDVNDSWLCHKRLGHASMRTLSKLVKNDYLWAS